MTRYDIIHDISPHLVQYNRSGGFRWRVDRRGGVSCSIPKSCSGCAPFRPGGCSASLAVAVCCRPANLGWQFHLLTGAVWVLVDLDHPLVPECCQGSAWHSSYASDPRVSSLVPRSPTVLCRTPVLFCPGIHLAPPLKFRT